MTNELPSRGQEATAARKAPEEEHEEETQEATVSLANASLAWMLQ